MGATVEADWRWTTDVGVKTYYFGPAGSREEKAVLATINGWRFGYPSCCIEEFVEDIVEGRHSGLRRGGVDTEDGGHYVPCSRCCESMGRELIK